MLAEFTAGDPIPTGHVTAIPALLELLEVKGCLSTIDALGCQTEIAAKAIEKQADYVLAVKGNKKHLYEAIVDYFDEAIVANKPDLCLLQTQVDTDVGHGRIETRRCYLSTCQTLCPRLKNGKV